MPTTRLYTPRPYDSFDSGVAGVATILATGTDVDNTKLTAVQAAAVANGLGTLPTSAGGTAPTPVSVPWRFRGSWQATTAYSFGDVVSVVDGSGNILYYSASLNFTSGSSFNATNWTEITYAGSGTSPMVVTGAPPANATQGALQVGGGKFDGTAGAFTGNANGTGIAVNLPVASTADMMRLEVGGVHYLSVRPNQLFVGSDATNGSVVLGIPPYQSNYSFIEPGAFEIFRPAVSPQIGMPWLLMGMEDGLEALTIGLAHTNGEYFTNGPAGASTGTALKDTVIRAFDPGKRVLIGQSNGSDSKAWTLGISYEKAILQATRTTAFAAFELDNDTGFIAGIDAFGSAFVTSGLFVANGFAMHSNGAGGMTIGTDNNAPLIAYTNSVEALRILGTGALKLKAPPAFVASDKYLVIDSSGNVHVSALGPAS